jgi:hypothetical protein
MTNLELNDVQTKALIRELGEIIRNDRYFLSPGAPDRGAKGDPGDAPTGAGPPGAAAATTQLRAAEHGAVGDCR